ncbi:MAG: hydrolase TatD [Phototrophicales bacterium]|nr:MAG: hydrolase TatD [Phototrophicales bacterium]
MTQPTLVDTHCHLDFSAYADDRDEVIANAQANGITRIINPGTDLATSQAALQLSEQYECVYAGVALHPNSTMAWSPEIIAALEHLASHPKVVAIGEIGLDYYWDKSPKEVQKAAFEAQLELARRLQLPVIIHNREASEDVIAILRAWVPTLPAHLKTRAGVLHSFSAPAHIAQEALSLGFYLGFTGPITFKKAEDLRRIAADVPLDRILIETDGPYLTPHPHRGKRNEPAYVRFIAERLAAIHQISEEEFATITTQNAEHLFRLAEHHHA